MGQTPRMKLCEKTDILREKAEYLTTTSHSSTGGSSHWTRRWQWFVCKIWKLSKEHL